MDFFDVLPFEKGEGRDFWDKKTPPRSSGWVEKLSIQFVRDLLKVAKKAGLHVSNI